MSEPVKPDDANDRSAHSAQHGSSLAFLRTVSQMLLWRWWRGSPKGHTLRSHDDERACRCRGDEMFDLQPSSMCSTGELVDDSSSDVLLPFVSYALLLGYGSYPSAAAFGCGDVGHLG